MAADFWWMHLLSNGVPAYSAIGCVCVCIIVSGAGLWGGVYRHRWEGKGGAVGKYRCLTNEHG